MSAPTVARFWSEVVEVPVQTSGVPQSVLRRADEFDRLTRDPRGTICRLDP